MKKLFTLGAFLVTVMLAYSQTTVFEKDYDGGYNDADEGFGLAQTSDDGYVMSGATWVSDDAWYDVSLMKADENGSLLWVKTYGMGTFNIEVGYAVVETNDGGYWIAGGTDGYTGNSDFWAIRTDENGDTLWTNHYGGDGEDYAYAGVQTNDGGYILAGATNSFGAGMDDVYVVKTDENGIEQWAKYYGTEMFDYANGIQQTADNGYIIVGSSNMDAYVIKIDENGAVVWENTYGGGATDEAFSVKQTDDGGYIVAGKNMSEGAGSYDVWLFKLDENGNMDWSQTYGGVEKDQGFDVAITDDGGYFITGYSESYHQAEEDSDMYIIKTDENGDEVWSFNYGDTHDDGGASGMQTPDGGYAAFGYKYVSGEGMNFYLVKTRSDGTVGVTDLFSPSVSLNIFPNPAYDVATVNFHNPDGKKYDLTVIDLTGKTVRVIENITDNKIAIEKGNLNNGMYFIELKGEDIQTGRIIFR